MENSDQTPPAPAKKSGDEANAVIPNPHPCPSPSPNPSEISAKSELYEICTAYRWKPPAFECCKQEGPPHLRMFTFKVKVEIGGEKGGTELECVGEPKTKKTIAAESAAQGAIWYLQNMGYYPVDKSGKGGKWKPNASIK